jgi:2-polyprenyl-3-methyl-5-hydroxy-6-metoxy-1,4-benzoquinol methylase
MPSDTSNHIRLKTSMRNLTDTAKCWCGNTDLSPFSPEYLKCTVCGTLVVAQMPEADNTRVSDDENDFYSREYWFSHQENDLGFSNIEIRSRTDLPERCLHWLRTVLKYKLPPAQVLEIGSAHGGFVAMLRWAGFDAMGLELSPWVVEFARGTFGVPILLGPVEDHEIEPSSLDLIVLTDVLEHLPDPVGTMRHCLSLLKPDGILIIQTPCLPEGRSYEDMVTQHDPFLKMLVEEEHLYLFSQHSIQELFHRLGVNHLAFEPAIFAHYDMFLAVSRAPLAVEPPAEIERALSSTLSGRLIQAMLDLDDQLHDLKQRHAAQLDQIHELARLLQESEADRAARLDQIHELTRLLQVSEADRAARLDQIHELTRLLQESEADRTARLDQIHELTRLLQESEADRTRAIQTLLAVSRSPTYRLLRRLGRWECVEEVLSNRQPGGNAD